MIYQVFLDGVNVYDTVDNRRLINGTADLELNGAGSCDITMPYGHESYDVPQTMKTDVDIVEDGKVVWFGRVTDISTNWNREKKVSAEGALAYFNDSILRPYSWDDVPLYLFFEQLIEMHNELVPTSRQFVVGYIREDAYDTRVTRTVEYSKTFDVIQEQIIDACGGYVMVRKEKNQNDEWTQYIDWFKDIPYNGAQPVEFGINLLDLSSNLVSSDILTAVIPLGDDGDGGKVTITGTTTQEEGYTVIRDYVQNDDAVDEYGLITEVVEFNDVSDPLILVEQGVQYLKSKQFDHISFECDVAELKYLDIETTAFEIGQNVRVYSTPHLIDKTLAISKMSYDITKANKKITIGTPPRQDLSQIAGNSYNGTTDSKVVSGGGGSGGGGGGGGGSTVSVRPIILTGDDIAVITVDSRSYYLKYDASGKADKSTTYTKTEVDTALALKADSNSVYTKTETDTALALKADSNSVYTKTETDTALALKADVDDVYSKSEVYNKNETYDQTEIDDAIAAVVYTLPIASASTLGGVKVGNTLTIDSETGELNSKSASEVIVTPTYDTGSTLANISINSTPHYIKLPFASDTVLGGIKIGDRLTINSETGSLSGDRTVFTGTTNPSRDLGTVGDIYVKYEWVEEHYKEEYEAKFLRAYVKMPTGDAQTYDPNYTEWVEVSSGSVISTGSSIPASGSGKDGDVYFQYKVVQEDFEEPYLLVETIYQKIEGNWVKFDNITKEQLLNETYIVKYKSLILYNKQALHVKSTTSNQFTRVLVIDKDFVMENRSPLELDFEFNMDITCDPYVPIDNTYYIYGDTVVRVIYKLDTEEFTYVPKHTVCDGKNVLSLHYALPVLEKQTYNFKLYLEIMNGEADIQVRDLIGTISGTGIDADGFSGILKIDDELNKFNPSNIFGIFTDDVDTDLIIPDDKEPTESLNGLNFNSMFNGFSDSLDIEEDTP